MNTAEIKRACLAEIERAYTICEEHFGVKFTRVPVEFSNRMTKCAGRALYKRIAGHVVPDRIKLSMPLIRLNGEKFVEDTPGHEAAHLICCEQFGYSSCRAQGGHGRQWQSIMKLIDRDMSRYHTMETVDNRVTMYCACETPHKVSKVRANKVRRGRASYGCNRCSTTLRFQKGNVGKLQITPINEAARRVPRSQASATITAPAPAPKPLPVVNTKTGVNAVCAMIGVFKKRNMDLTTILDNVKVVQNMAAQAGVTASDCRAMIKHNWSRI